LRWGAWFLLLFHLSLFTRRASGNASQDPFVLSVGALINRSADIALGFWRRHGCLLLFLIRPAKVFAELLTLLRITQPL